MASHEFTSAAKPAPSPMCLPKDIRRLYGRAEGPLCTVQDHIPDFVEAVQCDRRYLGYLSVLS